MKDAHTATTPLSYAEDQIVRRLAADGFAPREMCSEMHKRGFRRGRLTIRMHMQEHRIFVDRIAYHIRTGRPYRDGGGEMQRGQSRGGDVFISLLESTDLFAAAFAAGANGQRYEDHEKARPCLTTRVAASSATDYMTTGGVAVYG